jgi:hypothetical protein
MPELHISDPRERALVAAADRLLQVAALAARPFRRRVRPGVPRRILLLRMERIGDLVMALPAIADVRALAPEATIDLVVGSWNAELARAVPAVNHVESLDAAWLAREGKGRPLRSLLRTARTWRARLRPGVDSAGRTSLQPRGGRGRCGVDRRHRSGGGAPCRLALDFDTAAHTTANVTRRLVTATFRAHASDDCGPAARR